MALALAFLGGRAGGGLLPSARPKPARRTGKVNARLNRGRGNRWPRNKNRFGDFASGSTRRALGVNRGR